MKCENKRQLTTVKVVLRKAERRSFYPLISSLGVKMGVNIVNIIKSPLYFQSRHEISWIMGGLRDCSVNIGKTLRHGSGMSMLTCLLYTSPSPRDGLLSRMPSSA